MPSAAIGRLKTTMSLGAPNKVNDMPLDRNDVPWYMDPITSGMGGS